jgi:hypothetical protein
VTNEPLYAGATHESKPSICGALFRKQDFDRFEEQFHLLGAAAAIPSGAFSRIMASLLHFPK